ncbi:hypothetical protein D3C78_721280 [compost metagenome]
MPGGAEQLPVLVPQQDAVGARSLEGDIEATLGDAALGLRLILQAHRLPGHRLDRSALLAGVLEMHLLAGRTEALHRTDAVTRSPALDEDFLAGLDPVGRAVTGEDGQQVAARLLRGGQLQCRAALGIGA